MADYSEPNPGDRLSFTLFVAIAVHAMVIFGVGFTRESGQKIAPTLNVTLATHQDKSAPEKADFLAQHQQLASGTSDDTKELTTRKQADIADTRYREVNPLPQQKAVLENSAKTRLLSTQSEREHQTPDPTDPENQLQKEKHEGEDADVRWVNPEVASLQATLDRQKQELAKKPRIRRMTSVSTETAADAAYIYRWQKHVESIGDKNFPREALNQQIFGSLRLAVTLDRFGRVVASDITQASGHGILDDAALQIVKLAEPFPPLPPEVLKDNDQLEIIRTWRFEITGLSTSN